MPRELITDMGDPRLAAYRSLKATNQTRGLDQFVLEGEKLLRRLLSSRFRVVSVLVTDRHEASIGPLVPPEVPLYVVPFEQIHSVVGFPFHRGVLASARREAWPSWRELLPKPPGSVTLVIYPQVSNPENLGAIARIGDVFGVDAILAGETCPDPLSRRVLRVSMGASLRLPMITSDHLSEIGICLVEQHGVELVAAVTDPCSEPFDARPRPRRMALVLGDEDRGIDAHWLALCRRTVTIPMRPAASSLNVAVAAGILLHHFSRGPCE